jgi:hypothetical protein
MAKNLKNKYTTADGHAYLTKRTLVAKAQSAGKLAEDNAMRVMGFTIVVIGNEVVKKYADGRIEAVVKIAS